MLRLSTFSFRATLNYVATAMGRGHRGRKCPRQIACRKFLQHGPRLENLQRSRESLAPAASRCATVDCPESLLPWAVPRGVSEFSPDRRAQAPEMRASPCDPQAT